MRTARGRAAVVTPRAFTMDGFMDGLKREVDKTFNPRTRGAKIAGRAPGEERPTEVSPEQLAKWETEGDEGGTYRPDFDLQAFTQQLETQLRAESAAKTAVELAEEKVQADLAARLAEVHDGHGMMAAELGRVKVLEGVADKASSGADGESRSNGDEYGYMSKSERQMELERAYYGEDYVGEGPLDGRELALLCYAKYGKYHDMAVKHVRMGEDMDRWVSLNLYVGHLGQRSYPATEETYLQQMDAIAYMITSWGQADYARAFFREPPIARRGLPSKPRVDTCVTLQFNRSPTWDDAMGDEFFTY